MTLRRSAAAACLAACVAVCIAVAAPAPQVAADTDVRPLDLMLFGRVADAADRSDLLAAPVASLWSEQAPSDPQEVTFTVACADPEGCGAPDLIRWDFGDGTVVSGGATVSHRYTDVGAHTATVSVVTAEGVGVAALPVRIAPRYAADSATLWHAGALGFPASAALTTGSAVLDRPVIAAERDTTAADLTMLLAAATGLHRGPADCDAARTALDAAELDGWLPAEACDDEEPLGAFEVYAILAEVVGVDDGAPATFTFPEGEADAAKVAGLLGEGFRFAADNCPDDDEEPEGEPEEGGGADEPPCWDEPLRLGDLAGLTADADPQVAPLPFTVTASLDDGQLEMVVGDLPDTYTDVSVTATATGAGCGTVVEDEGDATWTATCTPDMPSEDGFPYTAATADLEVGVSVGTFTVRIGLPRDNQDEGV